MGGDNRNLGDLEGEMSGWTTATKDELKLDEGRLRTFLGVVSSAQSDLASQLTGAGGLLSWIKGAQVGTFPSAKTTKDNLADDVQSFINAVGAYKQYLTDLDTATRAACENLKRQAGN